MKRSLLPDNRWHRQFETAHEAIAEALRPDGGMPREWEADFGCGLC